MQPYRSHQPDAATAFRTGDAKVGLLTLSELGHIGADVVEALGVAQIPGSRKTFDLDGKERLTDRELVNRVPYLGWGGRLGVVSASCAAPDAAWAFLVDAGLPESMHIGHVRRRWIGELDGNARRVRSKADTRPARRLSQVPHRRGQLGFEPIGQTNQFALVFGKPGKAVDIDAGILWSNPSHNSGEKERRH